MRTKLHWASGLAVATTMFTAVVSAQGSGAFAEELVPAIITEEPQTQFVSEPVIQQLPAEQAQDVGATQAEEAAPVDAVSLAELVDAQPQPGDLGKQLFCLAGAIYFEARGETLDGQLAVGRVIIERAKSERFPNSYCDVVFQRSQFSFVRGNRMPTIRKSSKAWRRAVAMAQIAHEGSWDSPVEGALFFHAARISPGWRLTRLARVDNHIFYR